MVPGQTNSDLVSQACNEWRAITLARAYTHQYLFRRAIVASVKIIYDELMIRQRFCKNAQLSFCK